MATFTRRLIGAARLDPGTYEEVEADTRATGQAFAVVLLSSVAGGIGMLRLGVPSANSLMVGTAGALVGWVAWAALTYLIGTHLLPEPDTQSNIGELLRTLGFASAPGLLQVFAVLPGVGPLIFLTIQVWMLAAMVVAVRQALDYRSTARAIGVCLVGWLLSFAIALAMAGTFSQVVLWSL
jgi:hypothetical protein